VRDPRAGVAPLVLCREPKPILRLLFAAHEAPDLVRLDVRHLDAADEPVKRDSHLPPTFRRSRQIVSRWTPETRSVDRIEEPSTSRERQRVAARVAIAVLPSANGPTAAAAAGRGRGGGGGVHGDSQLDLLWHQECYPPCMAARGGPKADRTYSVMLRVRVAPEHDELIREAADSAARRKGSGDLSSWIRETLVAAARRELAKRGGDSAEG
jgi:hypothetical protein